MIEPIQNNNGVPRVTAHCDECDISEVMACDYERSAGGAWVPRTAQVIKRLNMRGWRESKVKLICPTCEAKRKAFKVAIKEVKSTEPDRQPTRTEKRQIMDLLNDVYESAAERYAGGETDETVAQTLGMLPGWVAAIREEFFGPFGGNDDMERLMARIEHADRVMNEQDETAERMKAELEDVQKKTKGVAAELAKMKAELAAIRTAVGPRVLRIAKGA